VEILLNTPLAKDYIRKGDIHKLKELMHKSEELGMQTFDGALFHLYEDYKINHKDALNSADSPTDLRLRIKLESNRFKETSSGDELTIKDDADEDNGVMRDKVR
jgi:twitching motility protein PilU